MRRRAVFLVLLAVVAMLLAGGCSETDEEAVANTIRDYYSAYNARDWDACLGHLADADGDGADRIQDLLETARAVTGEVTVESITNVKITGDTATAEVKTSYGGESKTEELPMVKKDGHWKINWHWY
jgi:ketosteroid isomerase-like protein